MQGWPPYGGVAAGYGSMYQQGGMGGQMPPMQGYGHAGFTTADQSHEWQTKNCGGWPVYDNPVATRAAPQNLDSDSEG